jgi:hypothetical protein
VTCATTTGHKHGPVQPQSALARLAKLEKFPPQKPNHEIYDAVYTPLPRLRQALSVDQQEHVKWKVDEDAEFELSRILTRQPYVYRTKLQWYVLHPEQIETPQLH